MVAASINAPAPFGVKVTISTMAKRFTLLLQLPGQRTQAECWVVARDQVNRDTFDIVFHPPLRVESNTKLRRLPAMSRLEC